KRRVHAFCGQPSRSGKADWKNRTGKFWLHYMHSQIWRDSTRRDYRSQALTNTSDVSRANVLLRPWRFRRRYDQRRRDNASWVALILLPLLVGIAGCGKRASLEKQYTEAHLQFWQGFTDQPLQGSELGLQASTDYPDLNWKFRILAAEANARKGRLTRALELL